MKGCKHGLLLEDFDLLKRFSANAAGCIAASNVRKGEEKECKFQPQIMHNISELGSEVYLFR